MGVEMIKDRQGRDQLVLSDEDFYNDDIIGDKLEDYEILQVFNTKKKEPIFMSKVRSKVNSKIYAMKKIGEEYAKESNEQNVKKEFEIFKNINSPNITKYFKYFYQDSCLYIIFEYVNNCDLKDLDETYKDLEKPIDTNTLWNIFMQCISALKYIHSKNIIHKNIKLSNIFMSENNLIKLGDFRFSFLENNKDLSMKEKKFYNEKTDIHAMGIVFHQLCYFTDTKNSSSKKNKGIYPKEMEDIIQLMLEEDENKMPETNELYDKIMEQYIKNAAKITSIDSVFRCMYSFNNFTEDMIKNAKSFLNNEETPISYNYINCIQNYAKQGNPKENAKYLNDFRNLLDKNSQMNNEIEIKPSLVIVFLLENLNKEEGVEFKSESLTIQKMNKNLNDFSKYMEDFKNKYKSDKSDIINYFVGFLKIKKICKICKNESNSFNFFPYIEFNMDIFDKNPNFQSWFKDQNEHYLDLSEDYNLECQICKKVTPQKEYKQFVKLPQNLIIVLNENGKCKIPEKMEYPLSLDLSQIFEKADSITKFNLVGLVKRIIKEEAEYYISIYLDPKQKCWFVSDCNNLTKIKNPLDHIDGTVLILFYSSIIDIGD